MIPIHLMELSPGSFRTFVVGTSYQLGNLVSSASSTIESTIGERFPLPPKESKGKLVKRYAYGKVICIFMACVFVYTIILALIGPENRGKHFDVQHDRDMEEATHTNLHDRGVGLEGSSSEDEKAVRREAEVV